MAGEKHDAPQPRDLDDPRCDAADESLEIVPELELDGPARIIAREAARRIVARMQRPGNWEAVNAVFRRETPPTAPGHMVEQPRMTPPPPTVRPAWLDEPLEDFEPNR